MKQLIAAVLVGEVKPRALIEHGLRVKKAAEDTGWQGAVGNAMQSPITQYALLGGGLGGGASILRNVFGEPDPDTEGSATSRFLKAMALGGAAGAGVAGGSKALGYDMPDLAKLVRGTKEPAAPRWQTSAGVGILGGLGTIGLAKLLRSRARNVRQMGTMNTLAAKIMKDKSMGDFLRRAKKWRVMSGPGKGSILDAKPGKGVDAKKFTEMQGALSGLFDKRPLADRRSGWQRFTDFVLGRNVRTRHLADTVKDLEHRGFSGRLDEVARLKDIIDEVKNTQGPIGGTWGQQMLYGGLGSGALHQMLGSE